MIISENMKTMCPAFSIIIPHKDIPDLLMRCLRSIPVSEDIQVIVVDDNSADADTYLDKCPELSRPYLEFVRTTKGKGAGYARNVGLDHAKGKWLLFADAEGSVRKGSMLMRMSNTWPTRTSSSWGYLLIHCSSGEI